MISILIHVSSQRWKQHSTPLYHVNAHVFGKLNLPLAINGFHVYKNGANIAIPLGLSKDRKSTLYLRSREPSCVTIGQLGPSMARLPKSPGLKKVLSVRHARSWRGEYSHLSIDCACTERRRNHLREVVKLYSALQLQTNKLCKAT